MEMTIPLRLRCAPAAAEDCNNIDNTKWNVEQDGLELIEAE
jgi:hypothetical protein